MVNINLLKEICETAGAPGFENRVRNLVLKEIKNHVDHTEIDNMGNVIALKKSLRTLAASLRPHFGKKR
jgi:endoglucanase